MSTKTISKRIALATSVALGAGVLSLVSVSSAFASAGDLVINANANTGASATTSQGVLPGYSASSGLAMTATLLSSGGISVTAADPGASVDSQIIVIGGSITSVSASDTTSSHMNLSADATTLGFDHTAAATSVLVKPNANVATFTIQSYNGNTSLTSASGSTLKAQLIVSLTGTSTVGTVSVTNSGIFYKATGGNTACGDAEASPADATTAGIGTSKTSEYQTACIVARDAYKSYLPANTLIQATATNGAIVGFPSAPANATAQRTSIAAPNVPAVSSAYLVTGYANEVGLLVSAPGNDPVSTIVTVTANGVVLGTKAFNFTGKVAKVTISSPSNGALSSTGKVTVAFADAAGNAVYPSSGAAKYSDGTKGTGIGSTITVTYPTDSTHPGSFTYSCAALNSTGQVQLQYTNSVDASVVLSNAVPVSCSGSPATYTAAFDKSSYNPGDLATLTVTFKDASGQLAADVSGAIADASNTPSIFGSNLTGTSGTAATAGTTSDATTNGVATYKFIVGSTAGSYRAFVDFPKIDTVATNAGLTQGTVAPAYVITSSGGTSLNDVLKGIVSLIASINKQIAALAKLVSKK
jgi:trimeric autotransporter adhesin